MSHNIPNKRPRNGNNYQHAVPANQTEEQRCIQEAINNSLRDSKGQESPGEAPDVPYGPTFYPTVEEFTQNPLDYIHKIQPIAAQYGICKIVPPKGWDPPFCVDLKSKKKFETKHQKLHRLQEGLTFGDGEEYTAEEYLKYGGEASKKWKVEHYGEEFGRKMTPENLEADYWKIVETQSSRIAVEYGNDIDTKEFWSGFPLSERGRSLLGTKDKAKLEKEPEFGSDDFYKECWWNLNNMPTLPRSVLRHVKCDITGVNIPWLYFGRLFSTFCWHNEDNYLYSINYHHKGAPKQWYGVPGARSAAEGFEKVFKSNLSMKVRDTPDLLHHITTMFSPRLLKQADVPCYKIVQYPGEFVVTFPRAFHGGFSLGPNVGEAVNFASPEWIGFGADANERYRGFSRPSVFSHERLVLTLTRYLDELSLSNSIQLVKELERFISEEIPLRNRLFEQGVRDISGQIELPANKIEHLNEESAEYDDKRLCYKCKHICFFSAVACVCSQSKVSCLRHSHGMCRCSPKKRYIMMWETASSLQKTLNSVKRHVEKLRITDDSATVTLYEPYENSSKPVKAPLPAPGSQKDITRHKDDDICCSLEYLLPQKKENPQDDSKDKSYPSPPRNMLWNPSQEINLQPSMSYYS